MNRVYASTLALAAATFAHSAASPYQGSLEPGAHTPGVMLVTFEGEPKATPRRIPALVFYPAKRDGEKQTLRRLIERGGGALPKSEQLDHIVLSRFGATPSGKKHPVVVFDGGLASDAFTYVPLNEFLASHGFIAISLPSLPHADGKPLAFDVAAIESKTRDVLTVLKQLDRIPAADTQRVAVAAWSVGGVSTTLAQMQDAKVRAVLSLDGGMGYDYGPRLAKETELYALNQATVPYLHVTGLKPNQFKVPKDSSFFDELPARQAWMAELQGLNHSHFTMQGGTLANLNEQNEAAKEFWAGNEALARLSLLFLNDFVANAKGHDFLAQANRVSPLLAVREGKSAKD